MFEVNPSIWTYLLLLLFRKNSESWTVYFTSALKYISSIFLYYDGFVYENVLLVNVISTYERTTKYGNQFYHLGNDNAKCRNLKDQWAWQLIRETRFHFKIAPPIIVTTIFKTVLAYNRKYPQTTMDRTELERSKYRSYGCTIASNRYTLLFWTADPALYVRRIVATKSYSSAVSAYVNGAVQNVTPKTTQ